MIQPPLQQRAICWACNYPLRGLTESRCPECGRAFDPDRPETMNINAKPIGAVARWFIGPPGWLTHAMCLFAALHPPWEFRRPGGNFAGGVSGMALWVLAGGLLLGQFLVALNVANAYHRPASEVGRRWGHWLVAPALLILCIFLSHLPLQHWAFQASRPAMDTLVADALQNPASFPPPRRVGVLRGRVEAIHAGGVHIFTGFGYDGAHCGYTYFPSGEAPADSDAASYRHVQGPWYEYWTRWGGFSTAAPPPPATAPATP